MRISPVEVKVEPVVHTTADQPVKLNDVPLDILRQFDIDHRTIVEGDKQKLNDIYTWAAEETEEPTPGNVMQKIRDIQNKLGGDRTFTKVWNWLRVKQN